MSGLFSLPLPVQALLATVFTWLVTAAGAALVLFTRKHRPSLMDALMSFSAGVMLASAFWSLLAPCLELSQELDQLPWLVALMGIMCGSLLLMGGDYVSSKVLRSTAFQDSQRRCWLLVASITLHNIPEGLAVGVAFGALTETSSEAALAGAWMLALGIALQNFPEGAAVSLPLRREGASRRKAFLWGQLSAAVEPVAGLLGALLAMHVRVLLPFMLSFAGGAMISVVVSELIPECQRSPRKSLMTLATLAGFCFMMVLDVALG